MAKRILVFDDKPENLKVAQQAYSHLQKYGFSVETTSNPDDVLDRIQKGEADILVTDLYVPREIVSPRIMKDWERITNETARFLRKNPGTIRYDRSSRGLVLVLTTTL